MRYLSVFSGIEAATVAWEPLGFHAIGFCEIDEFPSAVLNYHFPKVKNYGDITKFNEWSIEAGTVDVLVGGSPCQAFSVAGLRKGLADPRGNLALTFLALADKIKPKWIVWENVPGVLSSNGGRDFAAFIGALAQLGYGYAWRCLDAQYFGVPQRRKRIFLVATSTGNSELAAEVLSIREGLLGDSEKSDEQEQKASCADGSGASEDNLIESVKQRLAFGGNNTSGPIDIATCLSSCKSPTGRLDFASDTFITEQSSVVPFRKVRRAQNVEDFETWSNDVKSNTLNTFESTDVRTTHAIVHLSEFRLRGTFTPQNTCSTIKAQAKGGDTEPFVMADKELAIRRLTPLEAERLQGFPDNWTRIKWKNKEEQNCPDGLRYKAVGNSMAVPVMSWIGKQLLYAQNAQKNET